VELAAAHRLDHVLAEHEVLHVGVREEHALGAVEAAGPAHVEEPLHLLVDAADGLHLTEFTDPVTATDCFTGNPESTDRSAYSSAEEALSPSTPE
jgi:hypothetical protein